MQGSVLPLLHCNVHTAFFKSCEAGALYSLGQMRVVAIESALWLLTFIERLLQVFSYGTGVLEAWRRYFTYGPPCR